MNVDEMQNLTFEKRDEFNRKPMAEKIIRILNTESEDFTPMVIDGDWGTGKTEFCFKLVNLYKENIRDSVEDKIKNTTIIYFDAFENDYLNNPLISLLSTITNSLEKSNLKLRNKFISDIKTIFKNIPIVTLQTASNIVLGQEVTQFGKDLLKNQTPKNIIDVFTEIKHNMSSLKFILRSIAVNNPIILFIDELDRCRPDYTLKFLEIIKHTFDIPNIKFVFILNKKQLIPIIQNTYGNEIYLDKFFKLEISLQNIFFKTTKRTYVNNSLEYFLTLIKNDKILDYNIDNIISIIFDNWSVKFDHKSKFTFITVDLLKNWIEDCSLRKVEKVVNNLRLYKIITQKNLIENGWVTTNYDCIKFATILLFTLDKESALDFYKINKSELNPQEYNANMLSSLLKLPTDIFYVEDDGFFINFPFEIKNILDTLNLSV